MAADGSSQGSADGTSAGHDAVAPQEATAPPPTGDDSGGTPDVETTPDVGSPDTGTAQADTGTGMSMDSSVDSTVDSGTADTGADSTVDSGMSDSNPGDSNSTDATDAGPKDATAESAAETGSDASANDAAEGGGGTSACTVAPCAASGSNSVKCPGNLDSNSICTATEAVIVARDIANGNLTAGQLKPFDVNSMTGSCFGCLTHFQILDTSAGGGGNECEDLPSTAKTLDGEPALQGCVDTLQCIVDSKCTTADPPADCFCGTAAGSACLAAGAANGPCLQQEINGLDIGTCSNTYPAALSCTEGDPTMSQQAFYPHPELPAGMANVIMANAFSNCQSTCTP